LVRERVAERTKAERRSGMWRTARNIVLAAIPVGAAAVVFFTPVFAVRAGEVAVSGIGGVLTGQEVAAVLDEAVGTPLVRLNTGALAERLEELPAVKSAMIGRKWPTGLSVEIEVRVPVAVVRDEPSWALLDAEGVKIAKVAVVPADLPQVAVPAGAPRTLRAVLEVLETLPGDLRARIADVGGETEDSVHFTLETGEKVVWGDSSQPAVKAAALAALLKTKAELYNVSAPTMPFVRGGEADPTPSESPEEPPPETPE